MELTEEELDLELVLSVHAPGQSASETPSDTDTPPPPAKRLRPASCPTTLRTSAILLKAASLKFRNALSFTWARFEEENRRRIFITMDDGNELESWKHVLAYVHNSSPRLPSVTEDILGLLHLAQREMVDDCVLDCMRHLRAEVDDLESVWLLRILEYTQPHGNSTLGIDFEASALHSRTARRLACMLRTEPSLLGTKNVMDVVIGEFGILDDMLNEPDLVDLFGLLPFEFLHAWFQPHSAYKVKANYESTILAACMVWAFAQPMPPSFGDIMPLVRVFDIPSGILQRYYEGGMGLESQHHLFHAAMLIQSSPRGSRSYLFEHMAGHPTMSGLMHGWKYDSPRCIQPLQKGVIVNARMHSAFTIRRGFRAQHYWNGFMWHITLKRGEDDNASLAVWNAALGQRTLPNDELSTAALVCKLRVSFLQPDGACGASYTCDTTVMKTRGIHIPRIGTRDGGILMWQRACEWAVDGIIPISLYLNYLD